MPDRSGYKLGARPSRPDARTFKLERYLDMSALPPIPAAFDWGSKVANFGVHKNDVYGDCVLAAMANQIEADSADTSTEHVVPDAAVLKAYSDVTGFSPNDPSTDNGTDPLEALKYWRTTGIDGHLIGAFAAVDPRNITLVKAACYVLGGLQLAMTLPVSAQTQTVWDVVANDRGVWGGHQVYVRGVKDNNLLIETWNEAIEVTPAFLARYCGSDLYAVISNDWLNGQGQAPDGLNLAQLQADLAIVSGQPAPTPQPVATTTTLAASPASLNVGDSATLSASVTAADGSTPAGSVAFTAGGSRAGNGNAPTASASWTATSAGTVALTATYSGDSTHAASTGSASVTVYAAPVWKPNSTLLADIVWLEDVADYCFERYGAGTDASAATDTAHWLAAMAQEITALLPFLTGAATGEPPRTPRATPKLPGGAQ